MGHGTRPWCVPSGSTLSPFYLSKPEVKVAAQGLHPGPDPVGRTGGEKARERTPRRPALFTGSPLGPCAGSRSGGGTPPRWAWAMLPRQCPPQGEEGQHPRRSRPNSTSPGLSAFQADFKKGTGSPPSLAATTQDLKGARSQLRAPNSGELPRAKPSGPGPGLASSPAPREPPWRREPGKWRRRAPSPPRPP